MQQKKHLLPLELQLPHNKFLFQFQFRLVQQLLLQYFFFEQEAANKINNNKINKFLNILDKL